MNGMGPSHNRHHHFHRPGGGGHTPNHNNWSSFRSPPNNNASPGMHNHTPTNNGVPNPGVGSTSSSIHANNGSNIKPKHTIAPPGVPQPQPKTSVNWVPPRRERDTPVRGPPRTDRRYSGTGGGGGGSHSNLSHHFGSHMGGGTSSGGGGGPGSSGGGSGGNPHHSHNHARNYNSHWTGPSRNDVRIKQRPPVKFQPPMNKPPINSSSSSRYPHHVDRDRNLNDRGGGSGGGGFRQSSFERRRSFESDGVPKPSSGGGFIPKSASGGFVPKSAGSSTFVPKAGVGGGGSISSTFVPKSGVNSTTGGGFHFESSGNKNGGMPSGGIGGELATPRKFNNRDTKDKPMSGINNAAAAAAVGHGTQSSSLGDGSAIPHISSRVNFQPRPGANVSISPEVSSTPKSSHGHGLLVHSNFNNNFNNNYTTGSNSNLNPMGAPLNGVTKGLTFSPPPKHNVKDGAPHTQSMDSEHKSSAKKTSRNPNLDPRLAQKKPIRFTPPNVISNQTNTSKNVQLPSAKSSFTQNPSSTNSDPRKANRAQSDPSPRKSPDKESEDNKLPPLTLANLIGDTKKAQKVITELRKLNSNGHASLNDLENAPLETLHLPTNLEISRGISVLESKIKEQKKKKGDLEKEFKLALEQESRAVEEKKEKERLSIKDKCSSLKDEEKRILEESKKECATEDFKKKEATATHIEDKKEYDSEVAKVKDAIINIEEQKMKQRKVEKLKAVGSLRKRKIEEINKSFEGKLKKKHTDVTNARHSVQGAKKLMEVQGSMLKEAVRLFEESQSMTEVDCIEPDFDAGVSTELRSILAARKDEPHQMQKLVTSIMAENHARASLSQQKVLSLIPFTQFLDWEMSYDSNDQSKTDVLAPPNLIPEQSQGGEIQEADDDSNIRRYNARMSNLAREVTGEGDAMYTNPSETPLYPYIAKNHEMIKPSVKEHIRSKKADLYDHWKELAYEYQMRNKLYTKDKKAVSSNHCEPSSEYISMPMMHRSGRSRSNNMGSQLSARGRRARRGANVSNGMGNGDIVWSEYEQEQIIAELAAKENMEKRIKLGGSELPRQICQLERVSNDLFSFTNPFKNQYDRVF